MKRLRPWLILTVMLASMSGCISVPTPPPTPPAVIGAVPQMYRPEPRPQFTSTLTAVEVSWIRSLVTAYEKLCAEVAILRSEDPTTCRVK